MRSFPMRSMIHDITTAIELSQYTVNDTESMSVPDFPFFFLLSQGKWNCQGVSAEFQHPRAKIILLWAHAHAGPSVGVTAKWTDAKRG